MPPTLLPYLTVVAGLVGVLIRTHALSSNAQSSRQHRSAVTIAAALDLSRSRQSHLDCGLSDDHDALLAEANQRFERWADPLVQQVTP